ncbi:MAG: hypothetical protein WAM97_06000 [Acidimicrobiales bacterium]
MGVITETLIEAQSISGVNGSSPEQLMSVFADESASRDLSETEVLKVVLTRDR